MKELQDIWTEAGRSITAFSPFYQEDIFRLTRKYDAPNAWFILNWVRASDPEPFNLDKMTEIVGPYSTRERTVERFKEFIENGFLEKDASGGLTLTDSGRGLIEGFFDTAHVALSKVEPLAFSDMLVLQNLLGRIVEAAFQAPEPAVKTFLLNSRWTDPGKDAQPSVRIDQYVTDLYRFRDDTHIAVWRSYGVSGQVWETLTFVWRNDANTAEELAEQLSFRGYSEEEYGTALEKLVIKGWIEEINGKFSVTPIGKRIREEAEDKTDALFFASWSVLSEKELERFSDLVTSLNESLGRSGYEVTWEKALGVRRGVIPVTRDAVNPLFEEYFEEPRFFYPTLLATGVEPEPYSIDKYVKINPYSAPKQLNQTLEDIAKAGLMDNGSGAFKVSEKGHEALNTVNDTFYKRLGELEVLPDEELQEVSDILDRLIKASLEAEEPQEKPAAKTMHHVHPETEYALLARIDMQLDDLRAFRDDAYVASWRPYDVDGRTWESLSFIWQGQANSASKLKESLPFRGYEEDDYANSLSELVELGLIKKVDDGYALSSKGESLRLEAEETTNQLFFKPWKVLEDNEQTRLRNLLIRMKINLEDLAEREAELASA